MEHLKMKGILATFTTVVSYALNCFTELVAILVLLMLIDYLTGITAAYYRKDLQSSIGLRGIIKKVGFMILITLAFFLDYIIANSLLQIDVILPFQGTFGFATTIWLIGNEGISITENLGVIGVPLPPFLTDAFRKLKNKDDKKKEDDHNE